MSKGHSINSESGITLIELLIAMVLFLIVTGTIYGLMQVGRVDRNRSSRRSDALKNARATLQLIGRDAVNAGLGYQSAEVNVPDDFLGNTLGFINDPVDERDKLTPIITGDNLRINNLQSDPSARTDVIGFVSRNEYVFDSVPIVATNAASNTMSVASINIQPSPSPNPAPQVNGLYLAEEQAGSIRTAVLLTDIDLADNKLSFAPGDPLGINQAANGTGQSASLLLGCGSDPNSPANCMTRPAILTQIFLVTYHVEEDGTLIRTKYGNNQDTAEQIQRQPLAYGVRDLQFRYALRNGTMVDNPNEGQRTEIRQVFISLTVQGEGRDEATGQPTTVSIDGVFAIRNLEYGT